MWAAGRDGLQLSRIARLRGQMPRCCGYLVIHTRRALQRGSLGPSMTRPVDPNSMDQDTGLIGVLSILPFTSLMMSFSSGGVFDGGDCSCAWRDTAGAGNPSLGLELVREPEAQSQLGTEERW